MNAGGRRKKETNQSLCLQSMFCQSVWNTLFLKCRGLHPRPCSSEAKVCREQLYPMFIKIVSASSKEVETLPIDPEVMDEGHWAGRASFNQPFVYHAFRLPVEVMESDHWELTSVLISSIHVKTVVKSFRISDLCSARSLAPTCTTKVSILGWSAGWRECLVS